MTSRVVGLLVVFGLATTVFAENAPPGKEFYLGVPHEKKSSQVHLTDKQVLEMIGRHGEIQPVVDVDEDWFWDDVKADRAQFIQVLDGTLYYACRSAEHLPAPEGVPAPWRSVLGRRRVVRNGATDSNASDNQAFRLIWRETSGIPIEKVETPKGFTISPAKAVRPIMDRSSRAPWAEFYLFTSASKYYFGNTRKGTKPSSPEPGHWIIDGRTGETTRSEREDGARPAPRITKSRAVAIARKRLESETAREKPVSSRSAITSAMREALARIHRIHSGSDQKVMESALAEFHKEISKHDPRVFVRLAVPHLMRLEPRSSQTRALLSRALSEGWLGEYYARAMLVQAGAEAGPHIEAMVDGLDASDRSKRIDAIRLLGACGAKAKHSLPHLRAIVKRANAPREDFQRAYNVDSPAPEHVQAHWAVRRIETSLQKEDGGSLLGKPVTALIGPLDLYDIAVSQHKDGKITVAEARQALEQSELIDPTLPIVRLNAFPEQATITLTRKDNPKHKIWIQLAGLGLYQDILTYVFEYELPEKQ